MLVLLIKGVYQVEMASYGMINKYERSFMKICIGIQEMLWFCYRNLKGCNAGVTGRKIYELCHSDEVR
jgi:hypothetical protein